MKWSQVKGTVSPGDLVAVARYYGAQWGVNMQPVPNQDYSTIKGCWDSDVKCSHRLTGSSLFWFYNRAENVCLAPAHVLVGNVVNPLGGGDSLKETVHWQEALKLKTLTPLPSHTLILECRHYMTFQMVAGSCHQTFFAFCHIFLAMMGAFS